MPNAAAPQSISPAITFTDDHLKNMQQNVASQLQSAGVNTNYQAVKPIHVPEEGAKKIIDEGRIQVEKSIPESFNSTPETALSPLKAISEHLDYADQLVTGRTHVIGESNRFTAHKLEKEDKKMKFKNEPQKDSSNPVKKFVDWLYE